MASFTEISPLCTETSGHAKWVRINEERTVGRTTLEQCSPPSAVGGGINVVFYYSYCVQAAPGLTETDAPEHTDSCD